MTDASEAALAEAIAAAGSTQLVIFALYVLMPHSLAVPAVAVPLFEQEPLWPGWGADVATRVCGLPVGSQQRPLACLRFRRARGGGGAAPGAIDRDYPDIVDRYLHGAERLRHRRETLLSALRWRRVRTTAVEITLFVSADVLRDGKEVPERRLAVQALGVIDRFVISLGIVANDWLLGSVAPGELPTPAPYLWRIVDAAGAVRAHGRDEIGLHHFAEATTRPVASGAVHAAANLFRAGREGREPAYPIGELRLEAQRDALRGRRANAVLLYTASIEALVDLCLRRTAAPLGRTQAQTDEALGRPLLRRLAVLVDEILTWAENVCAARDRWLVDCYQLRKRVIHEGEVADEAAVLVAMRATYAFTAAIGAALAADPRTRGVAGALPEHSSL